MSHTPGPWRLTPDKTKVTTAIQQENCKVADCGGLFSVADSAEREANASLIAAAPDLYAAARAAFDQLEAIRTGKGVNNIELAEAQGQIIAAIAKARGHE